MLRPASTTARGSSAGSARARRFGVIAVDSDSVRTPARRSISSSDWAYSASTSSGSGGVEHEHAGSSGRRRGQPLERGQPRGGVAPAELVLGSPASGRLVGVGGDSFEQHLLDRPLDRAEREALLEQTVGLVLVERGEGGGEARAGRRSLAALTGQRDRRGDVVGLGERGAQRLDLGQRVLAVAAGRPARAREPVAPLPAAERVGADAEHHGSGVRANSVHQLELSRSARRTASAARRPAKLRKK